MFPSVSYGRLGSHGRIRGGILADIAFSLFLAILLLSSFKQQEVVLLLLPRTRTRTLRLVTIS